MLGCYRKGDAADPNTYAAAIAATLAQFPEHVVKKVTNPVTGIPGKIAFLPSVAEVRSACDFEILAEDSAVRAARKFEEDEISAELAAEKSKMQNIAACHFWLRAKEAGDPLADAKIGGYSQEARDEASRMTMREALEIIPEMESRLSRSVEKYGLIRAEGWK